MLLPLFQIISHSKNLGESTISKFDQNYKEKYKDLWHVHYENIANKESNDT